MDATLLEVVGKVAGIGGIALGVFLLLFKNLIRKLVFPQLTREQAFHVIKMMMWLIFAIAFIGILAWLASQYLSRPTPASDITAQLPAFSTSLDTERNLIIRNVGGPAFNIQRVSSSALKYAVATSKRKSADLFVARVYTQFEPGMVGVGSPGGDASWFRIDHKLFARVNEQFCTYIAGKELNPKYSSVRLELDALLKYDDSNGQGHRRAWLVHLIGSCPLATTNEILIYQGNAADFKSKTNCQTQFPMNDEGQIASAAIKQIVRDVVEGNSTC